MLQSDFVPVYAGTRCLLAGCNPYNVRDLQQQFEKAGGSPMEQGPWAEEVPVYPPSTFVALLPFGLLPYHAARAAWFLVSAVLLIVAGILIVVMSPPRAQTIAILLSSLVLATSKNLLGLGQPATLTIALLIFALWAESKAKMPRLATICLALSLAIKPHLGIGVLIYLLLRKQYRPTARRALTLVVLTFPLSTFPVSLVSSRAPAQWMHTLKQNLATTTVAGSVNDPSPTNPKAQQMMETDAVVSVFNPDPQFYVPISRLVVALLCLLWLAAVLRSKASFTNDALAIAGAVCLTLMPIYHRVYDSRLLFLTIPALAMLLIRDRRWGIVGALVSVQCLSFEPYIGVGIRHLLESKFHLATDVRVWRTLLFWRHSSLCLLATAVFYVVYFFWRSGQGQKNSLSPN